MLRSQKYCLLLPISLLLAGIAAAGSGPAWAARADGQAPAQATGQAAPTAARLLGTVTATAADSLTIKLESGVEATISVGPATRLLRTAPGEKTLKGASAIQLSDLATGDRVLVLRPVAGADATHYTAAAIVTMKQEDIAQAHATEAEDWQKRGVGGIVQSIAAAGPGPGGSGMHGPGPAGGEPAATGPGPAGPAILIGTAQPGRTLTIHITPQTIIRRYASDSVKFADSRPATLSDIHPGDQLRARGDRSADGADVNAVEIVAGSFRNVAGPITAIDPEKNTVTVSDLATKKPVTLRLTPETQMRKLPPEMAQRLAARTSLARAGEQPGAGRASAGAGNGSAPGGRMLPPGPGAPTGAGQMSRAGTGSDPTAMLQRAPLVSLAELKQGEAIMVVAARGGGGSASDAATAITLIAGVEPLLEGSSSSGASQNLFSASWNLGGGGAAEAAP
jgi:hypothetical protein